MLFVANLNDTPLNLFRKHNLFRKTITVLLPGLLWVFSISGTTSPSSLQLVHSSIHSEAIKTEYALFYWPPNNKTDNNFSKMAHISFNLAESGEMNEMEISEKTGGKCLKSYKPIWKSKCGYGWIIHTHGSNNCSCCWLPLTGLVETNWPGRIIEMVNKV